MNEAKAIVNVEKRTWDEALENESWVAPLVDIYETKDDFYLNAYMPGVNKDDIKIKMEEENLVIMGRINFENVNSRKYVLRESDSSNFYRKFRISDSVDYENIEANMENGILSIKLPKHERVKPRNIEIK